MLFLNKLYTLFILLTILENVAATTRLKRGPGLISQPSLLRSLDGVYITAQLSTYQMQRLYREERTFIVGDEKVSFYNIKNKVTINYNCKNIINVFLFKI